VSYKAGIFNVWSMSIGYFIGYKTRVSDKEVANVIQIPVEDYVNILKSYNAQLDTGEYFTNEYFFNKRSDAIKCAEFLNEKYGLLIKLMEI